MKNAFFLLLLGTLLSRCESAGTGEIISIPDFQIDCQTTQCAAVATGSYDLVVNVTSSGCAVDQIELAPVIAGTASVICTNGSGCLGTVTSWRDTNSNATTQIQSSTYSLCGWIDLDNLSTKNPADAFAEENRFVSAATIRLSDWGAANYSRARRVQSF